MGLVPTRLHSSPITTHKSIILLPTWPAKIGNSLIYKHAQPSISPTFPTSRATATSQTWDAYLSTNNTKLEVKSWTIIYSKLWWYQSGVILLVVTAVAIYKSIKPTMKWTPTATNLSSNTLRPAMQIWIRLIGIII